MEISPDGVIEAREPGWDEVCVQDLSEEDGENLEALVQALIDSPQEGPGVELCPDCISYSLSYTLGEVSGSVLGQLEAAPSQPEVGFLVSAVQRIRSDALEACGAAAQ